MKELGFYTYAYLIANLPSTHFTKVFSEVIFPSYSRISGERLKLKNAYLSVMKFVAYIAFPMGAGIFMFSKEIVRLLLGEVWDPVISPLQILVVFGIVRSLAATTGPVFKAVGKPNIIFYVTLGKLIVILATIFPLIKAYGIMGAALAVTLPMLFEQLFLWKIVSRTISVSLPEIGKSMIFPCITGLVIAGCVAILKSFFPAHSILTLGLYFLFIIILASSISLLMDKKFFLRVLNA